ncbi:unnamed protein product [Schistosoma curassoni]|nr:unnamed protein product [Schistosoma curassoni]
MCHCSVFVTRLSNPDREIDLSMLCLLIDERCCPTSYNSVFGLLSPIEQLDPLDMFSAGIKRLQKLYKLM